MTRGLLLDFLPSGDRDLIEATMDHFLRHYLPLEPDKNARARTRAKKQAGRGARPTGRRRKAGNA